MNSVYIFVPGRISLMGEHSDTLSLNYMKSYGKETKVGYSLTANITNLGITAKVYPNNESSIIVTDSNNYYEHSIFIGRYTPNDESVNNILGSAINRMLSYVVYIKGIKPVGFNIDIINNTLPIRSGLSSSAAIVVLVIRAFNVIYNFNFTEREIEHLAHSVEYEMGVKCGKMDQVVAYNSFDSNIVYSRYNAFLDGNRRDVDRCIIHSIYYLPILLIVTNKNKDTSKILKYLRNSGEEDIDKYYFEYIPKYVDAMIDTLEYKSNHEELIKEIGAVFNASQQEYQKMVAFHYPELLSDNLICKIGNELKHQGYIAGYKGNGSHGDCSGLFLCKTPEDREKAKEYLRNQNNKEMSKCSLIDVDIKSTPYKYHESTGAFKHLDK